MESINQTTLCVNMQLSVICKIKGRGQNRNKIGAMGFIHFKMSN